MPVIVFHSDRDHTVQQTNVGTSCSKPGTRAAPRRETLYRVSTQTGVASRRVASGGRRLRRTAHVDAAGRA